MKILGENLIMLLVLDSTMFPLFYVGIDGKWKKSCGSGVSMSVMCYGFPMASLLTGSLSSPEKLAQ